MPDKRNILKNEYIYAYSQIALGCVLGAIAYPLFLVPNHIAPGGLTGLATVINYIWSALPVGTTSLVLNVPLFVIGYRSMGKVFALRSLIATVLFSLLIDIIPLEPLTRDPMLGAVFGGVLLGLGLGFILRGGATTGGSDMAARMLHARFQFLSVGSILMSIDCLVVLLAGFTIQAEYALYAFISIYVSSRVIDMVLVGISREMACYVITSEYERVMKDVMEQLSRGVTLMSAKGGYSGANRPVLLCVLSQQEVGRLKAIVRTADEKAFVFISDAHEVLGEGFRDLKD